MLWVLFNRTALCVPAIGHEIIGRSVAAGAVRVDPTRGWNGCMECWRKKRRLSLDDRAGTRVAFLPRRPDAFCWFSRPVSAAIFQRLDAVRSTCLHGVLCNGHGRKENLYARATCKRVARRRYDSEGTALSTETRGVYDIVW